MLHTIFIAHALVLSANQVAPPPVSPGEASSAPVALPPAAAGSPGAMPATPQPSVPAATPHADQEETPTARIAVNPVTSIPVPGPIPGGGLPAMDAIAAYATVSTKDTEVRVAASPAAFIRHRGYVPLLSDTRVELYGNASTKIVGGVLSLGWSNISKRLIHPSTGEMRGKCYAKVAPSILKDLEPKVTSFGALTGSKPPAQVQPPDDQASAAASKAYADYVRALPIHVGELTAAWKNRGGSDKDVEPIIALSEKLAAEVAACQGKALREYRMAAAYRHGVIVLVSGGAEMFPYFKVPRPEKPLCTAEQTPAGDNCTAMDATEKEYQSASGRALAGWKLKASLAYFPSQRVGVFLTGSVSGERKDPRKEELGIRAGAGAALISNVIVGEVQEDGFLPGIGVGAAVDYQRCARNKCDTKVVGLDSALMMKDTFAVTPLIEVRASSKAQFAISLPIQWIRLSEAVSKTDGALSAFQVIPTLSVGVASWGIRPRK